MRARRRRRLVLPLLALCALLAAAPVALGEDAQANFTWTPSAPLTGEVL
jgi:hypothetical protein